MIDKFTVTEALRALAHDARLEVFLILVAAGPEGLAAGALGKRLDLAPSALSFHLTRLRHAGLVQARRDGQRIRYSACYERMDDLVGFLTEHCCRDSDETCGPVCGGPKQVLSESGPHEQPRTPTAPDGSATTPTNRGD